MDITFVLPSRTTSGGTRIVFQHTNELIARGHNVTILYPKLPPYFADLVRTIGFKDLIQKWFESSDLGTEIQWTVEAEVRSLPTLSPVVQRLWHRQIPNNDVILTASWRTAKAIHRLPDSKGIQYHLVQDYEVWDVWNSSECWRQARSAAASPSDICLEMCDVEPDDSHVARQKARVDEALELPLEKIVVSPWLRTLIEDRIGCPVHRTVPNGIDTDVFYPDDTAPHAFSEDDGIRILAPSRSPPYKGIDTLLTAFEQLRETHADVEFYVYGSSHSALPEWVNYTGRVPDEELRRLYSNADFFAAPSHAEGWGLPSTEAAACRTAVVSTNTGWVRDYTDGRTVRSVPPKNPEALAAAISELIQDEKLRTKVADRAHGLVTENFTMERSTDLLEQALFDIVGR